MKIINPGWGGKRQLAIIYLMFLLSAFITITVFGENIKTFSFDRADKPDSLQEASWIWTENQHNNQWVDFFHQFSLEQVPQAAVAEIGVENKYRLFINGTQVVHDGGLKRGPDKNNGYFDRVNIAPFLKTGNNTICIKAWFWGIKGSEARSFSNVPLENAGLIFAANIDGYIIVSNDTWKCKEDEAFKDDGSFGKTQPNFRLPEYNILYVASDQQDYGWFYDGYDHSSWPQADVKGAYGDKPWNELMVRPIPFYRDFGLTDYVNSQDYVGYTTDSETDIVMTLPYNAQIEPYLEVYANVEGEISIMTENTLGMQGVYITYVTNATGKQSFESPAWISGQYVTYHLPAGITILRLAYRETGYDTDIAGSFSMENGFYDALWEMSVRTQYLCIRESFMDCPDRERAQWTGDVACQIKQCMYCMDPKVYPLYTKYLTQKYAWITVGDGKGELDNQLPTVVPIFNGFYHLPVQEMAGIVGVWDYFYFTGDDTALRMVYYPAIRYLQSWEIGPDDLVVHKKGHGLENWHDPGSNVDTIVSENAWYYWCLTTLQKIAKVLGEDDSWLVTSSKMIEKGFESLWVEGVGYTTKKKPDDRSNALAVLSGLAPENRYEAILGIFKTTNNASCYMESYVLEAMFRMGAMDDALDRMHRRFGNMVSKNLESGYTTLWEYFDEGTGSQNHAWSSCAAYLLPAYVGGIRPTSPGFDTCIIAPDFSHSERISACIETVKGMITVNGTAQELEVFIPKNVKANVILPGGISIVNEY